MKTADFAWDDRKDADNRQKHGVSFYEAQYVFADPHRVIVQDLEHGEGERRFFCIGKAGSAIMTVRFTCEQVKSESLAPATGERVEKYMSKKIKYTDEPMNTGRVVKDFLPRPDALSFKKEQVVTLRLDEPTVEALKSEARKKGLGVSTLVRMWVRERLAGNAAP